MRSIPYLIFIALVAFIFALFWSVSESLAFPYENLDDSIEVGDYDDTLSHYINFHTFSTSSLEYIVLSLKGDCTQDGTYPNINFAVNGAGSVETLPTNIDNNIQDDHFFYFSDPLEVPAGQHWFKLNVNVCSELPVLYGSTNPYSTTTEILYYYPSSPAGDQTTLPYFYVLDQYTYSPEQDGQYYDLSDDCPDILSYPQTCFVGEDCTFWVQYNELTVASDLHLVTPTSPYIPDAIDSLTAEYNAEFAMPFTIPYTSQATGTIEEYCIYTELLNEYDCLFGLDEFVECGYYATWVDREEYERNFRERMDSLSDDYASTTELAGWCEEICTEEEGFFSCGLKKAGCFLFIPSPNTMRELEMNIESAKGEFPLNMFYEVKYTLDYSASSSVDGLTIRNPLDIVSGASTTLTIGSSSISDTLGFPLYNKLYELMEQILYILSTGAILIYVYKTFFNKEEYDY